MNPQDVWITFPELLVWFPLLAGLVCFLFKDNSKVKSWVLLASIITLCISFTSLYFSDDTKYLALNKVSYTLKYMNNGNFILGLDGMGRLLTLLTAFAFPIIFVATYNTRYKNAKNFYALMLLAQSGLMGVFTAMDAMSFYFFWELALIPVYFLSSQWGGEKRIQATFKFFVYTFVGSLLMLIGIIYVYLHTINISGTGHSFALYAFTGSRLDPTEQMWLFWLFFVAFAIKMPIFPFHTWQPDAYEQAPTATTMVMSGIMVKMGLFACLRWLLPIFPQAVIKFDNIVIGLSVFGMIYASLIAIKQDDIKRLAAYSSIAHIGLMCAGIFTKTEVGLQGVMLQMFCHGINIIGLWVVIELLERQTGVRKLSQLGGVAHKAPTLTILLVVIALANIALPLTNAFVGEFMLFNGLFAFNVWYAAVAGISIILAAVYTLNMIQKIFYGEGNSITTLIKEIALHEKIILCVVVVLIFMMGIYPQPMINLTQNTVDAILLKFN